MIRDVGDRQNVGYEARDPDTGALTAATVALTVTKPDGTTSTPAVSTPSTGVYRASFDLTTAGPWRWEWDVSGTIVDHAEDQVTVGDPGPGTYANLAALRDRIGVTEGDRDAALQRALSAGARAFDRDTGRRPGGFQLEATATARIYKTRGRVVCTGDGEKLLIDEIGSTTGLIVEVGDGTTWTAVTDYDTEPENALADRQPITALLRRNGTWGCDRVRVTARWGWPAMPDDAPEAVLIAAQRLYNRKDSWQGIAGSTDFGTVRLSRIDPDYRRIVESLSLPGIA